MYRTLLTVALSVVISVSSTMLYYHITTVQVITPPAAACPEVQTLSQELQDYYAKPTDVGETYTPRGHRLSAPVLGGK